MSLFTLVQLKLIIFHARDIISVIKIIYLLLFLLLFFFVIARLISRYNLSTIQFYSDKVVRDLPREPCLLFAIRFSFVSVPNFPRGKRVFSVEQVTETAR